jgi:hypothetical protein
MKYFELLATEKNYYDKLTGDERKIYCANQEQLAAISTWNDFAVRSFVDASRLMNELHRLHSRYNELMEKYDDPVFIENNIEFLLEETFSMSISIGLFSSVFRLTNMDECDALYGYLSKVKMSRFDWLCDNFDISVLI